MNELPETSPSRSPRGDGSVPRTRRDLLVLGLGAGAGAAASVAFSGAPAGATGGDIIIDTVNTGGGGFTVLQSSTFQAAVQDAGGQVFDVRAFGALGDGVTPDDTAIGNAQAAAGAGCVYFPPGTYVVSGLNITTRGQTFRIESGATIILAGGLSTPRPVITVTQPNVSVLGPGTVDGNAGSQSGTLNGFDGVKFAAGADDGLIDSVVVQNAAWIGIRADGANRTRISFNEVTSCGHAGISSSTTTTTFEGPLIIGNTVLLGPAGVSAGINVQGSSATVLVSTPRVVGNHVELTGTGIGLQIFFCQYAKITDNTATGSNQVFSVVGGSDNVVSSNTAMPTGGGAGIEFGSNFSVCVGNAVACTGTGVGITADNSTGTHIVIGNNKVTGAQAQGIRIAAYDHVSVIGNVIHQSASATAAFGVLEVSPTGTQPGLIVVGDNVIDGGGASNYGICVKNLVSEAVQITIHDNAFAGIASTTLVVPAAVHFAGAGTATDVLVHDNTIASGISLYSVASGLTLGGNVRFHDNIIVGVGDAGMLDLTLPASGTPYVNTTPFTQVVYLQGGTLSGTGTTQGVVKNGRAFVNAGLKLTFPMPIVLEPGESFTVYYTVAPSAWKDVKG